MAEGLSKYPGQRWKEVKDLIVLSLTKSDMLDFNIYCVVNKPKPKPKPKK